jgi:hypothetical protein
VNIGTGLKARSVREVIDRYAQAYADLQRLQCEMPELIPIGDQKTGCIGEFYASLYLRGRYPEAEIAFAGASNSGWDIDVANGPVHSRIQVKTVSEHSQTRRISPIFAGWDELYLVYLNLKLRPAGFWVITDTSIVASDRPMLHSTCPSPCGWYGGSAKLRLGPNRVEEFMQFVNVVLEA